MSRGERTVNAAPMLVTPETHHTAAFNNEHRLGEGHPALQTTKLTKEGA
jgi:hypothetical protein